MDFHIDFDDGKKKYERIIDVSGISSFTIGADLDCNIAIKSEYVKDDIIVFHENAEGYEVNIQNTTYGVYINAKKAKDRDILKNGDFISISDYFFYYKLPVYFK
jgi:S-DNA-T family DNA segregation ATPase FtsK/SpoIIIE